MSLYEEIQAERAKYPEDSESAVLPALRLAQDEYGWLSPDALREVADALETTPAFCKSIASFYDQFHLAPVGEHLVEVCTNVSCAVVGAQQVVEAFERELGCYICSDGGPRPWRVKFRAPSFVALEATATCMSDALIADMIAIVGSLDTVMGEVDR